MEFCTCSLVIAITASLVPLYLSLYTMAASNRSTGNSGSAAAEMEFMRKEDSSWHPCHVSLSVTGVDLVVNYENADNEDIVLNGEEALAGLRMRSVPLNGDDCAHIQEGDHILATGKLQANCLFFDAVVEKALRVRHSKRAPCRCTFGIKWLRQDLNERTLTVTTSSIMKLATTSINEHPTICAFFSKLKNSRNSNFPVPNIENDIDHEMDLYELLEKQIEVINNSVDNSERFSEDPLSGIQFNEKGEIQCRAVAKFEATKSFVSVPSDSITPQRVTRSATKLVLTDSTTPRRITRKASELQTEMKNTNPPPPHSFIHGLPEIPSLLNPLGSCAAFASLLSKVPHVSKFSGKLNFMQSLSETNSLKCPDICTQTTPSISYEPQSSNTSSEISTLVRVHGNKSSEVPHTVPSLNSSAAKRKLNTPLPPKATKIARAATAKGFTHMETCVENKKLVSPKTLGRVTRSVVGKINKDQTLNSKQLMEHGIPDKLINSGNDIEPTFNLEIEMCFQENSNLGVKEGKELEAQRNSAAGLRNPTITSRLTRSKVLEKKMSPTIDATAVLGDDKFAETAWSSSSEGKDSASYGKAAGTAGSKKIGKNEARRSPRLQLLPRTRSLKN